MAAEHLLVAPKLIARHANPVDNVAALLVLPTNFDPACNRGSCTHTLGASLPIPLRPGWNWH